MIKESEGPDRLDWWIPKYWMNEEEHSQTVLSSSPRWNTSVTSWRVKCHFFTDKVWMKVWTLDDVLSKRFDLLWQEFPPEHQTYVTKSIGKKIIKCLQQHHTVQKSLVCFRPSKKTLENNHRPMNTTKTTLNALSLVIARKFKIVTERFLWNRLLSQPS